MEVDQLLYIPELHSNIPASEVRCTLSRTMLIDGFEMVLDLRKSHGSFLVDAQTGQEFLDFFTFFASNPLGMNHPKMQEPEFREKLLLAALHKPSNSDMYTTLMAEFVAEFQSMAMPSHMNYLFFIEGGAAAVENGLKIAFDWKVRHNFQKGWKTERGHKVIHFREAFHGRSGYTLSLTNTDPVKYEYFPKFAFPRIINPKITYPLQEQLANIKKAEQQAVDEIYSALKQNQDDIALIIIEPVQCEGGDNFFRKEFFVKLREIADEHNILLMFDEVQTGFGMTGKTWAFEHYVKPDLLAFGKKVQLCGVMASSRIDTIDDHCFKKSGRINSTWGGNLTDMVRSTRIMEIMQEDHLVENARIMGNYLLNRLQELQTEFPRLVANARGLGLLCAFDLPDKSKRNNFKDYLFSHGMMVLGCGEKSIRFRPALTVTEEEIDLGLEKIKEALNLLNK